MTSKAIPRRARHLFEAELPNLTPKHTQVSRHYETWYHVNDFVAGVTFVVGSALFFSEKTQMAATWLFLVGSVLFTVRPAIRLARDMHLLRLPEGDSGEDA